MKTNIIIATITTAAVVSVSTHHVQAGQKEWATAGKILTGVVAASVIHQAMQPRVVYTHPTSQRGYQRTDVHTTTYRHTSRQPNRRTTTTRRTITYHRPPASPACSGQVIVHVNRRTRLYQPRIHGHVAWVQNWCPHTRTWISVQHHPSIW